MIWIGHNFCTFPARDIDFAQITFGQGHDTPPAHKQSLCKVRTTNEKIRTGHKFCIFPASDLDLAQISLGQWHDTLRSYAIIV